MRISELKTLLEELNPDDDLIVLFESREADTGADTSYSIDDVDDRDNFFVLISYD